MSSRSFLTCTLGSTILVSEKTREVSDQIANGKCTHSARFVSLSKGNSIVNGQNRKDIKPGLQVEIVMKQDQRSGRRTRGIVKDILTSSLHHSRGIKVRLESGAVGRVQEIVG